MTHPEQTPDATASDPASPRSRRPAALAVGAALVLGGIALAIWAVASTGAPAPRDAASPLTTSASSTATPGASLAGESAAAPTPAASTPPASSADAPIISTFTVEPLTVLCPDDRASTVPLTFSWRTEGADRAWIGIATTDASVQPFAEVDPSAGGYTGIAYACSDADQVFTLTVQGPGGSASETIAVTREVD